MSREHAKSLARLKTKFLINSEFGYLNSQVSDTQALEYFPDQTGVNDIEDVEAIEDSGDQINHGSIKEENDTALTAKRKRGAEVEPQAHKSQKTEPSMSSVSSHSGITILKLLEDRIVALESKQQVTENIDKRLFRIEQEIQSLQRQVAIDTETTRTKSERVAVQLGRLQGVISDYGEGRRRKLTDKDEVADMDESSCFDGRGDDLVWSEDLELGYEQSQDPGAPWPSDDHLEHVKSSPRTPQEEDPYIPSLESQIERAIIAGGSGRVRGKPPCVDRGVWGANT